jgi:beta-glucosidase
MATSFKFPDGFLWGTATASHQVEGNNRWNDWWWHENNGDLPFKSGNACDHYSLYEQDFDLAKSLGQNAHRLSIEWSRVEPEEGQWNSAALDHYRDVIASLRERDIEPIVTLHHFTNPQWFARTRAWQRDDSAELFARYVSRVAEALPDVKYWVTINEPTVYIKNGYGTGCWPPFEKNKIGKAGRVIRNLARAHVLAYCELHANVAEPCVGIAHSAPYVAACRESDWRDRAVARLRDLILNDLFFWLVKRSAKVRSYSEIFDFIGLNYYTRTLVRYATAGLRIVFGTECKESHHQDLGSENELGWLVHAPGLKEISKKFAKYGVPLIITENGCATTEDAQRADFIKDHIAQVAAAIGSGIDIRGYLYWTLFDNFEWSHGYNAHFGLAKYDGTTGARVTRPSSDVYADICKSNRLAID